MSNLKEIRIGVFVPQGVQLLDLSAVDLFAMMSPSYIEACQLPGPLIALGTPSTIHYISTTKSGTHVELTASAFLRVSKIISDPEVQPGMLDIVLIPGPNPAAVFAPEELDFVRKHANWRGENGRSADILSVCTGCFLVAQSGVFKGKKASGPRDLVPKLRKAFPDTTWVEDKRWVKDGNIWSSGGITNGHEMVAAYMRENFPGPVAEVAIAMADVGHKGIDYDKSGTQNTLWWLWQILKALTFGNGKQKKL